MITALPQVSRSRVSRFMLHALLAGTASTIAILLGVVPSVEQSTGLTFSSAAYAQSISDQELERYARSVLEIEPLRQAAYDQIKQINGSVPDIRCHEPDSLSGLPSSIRGIAETYCERATTIAAQNQLGIVRFNQITVAQQNDANLRSRIQQVLLQLQ